MTPRRCVRCETATDNWCQICKKTMCRDCLTDHSHGLDGKDELR